MEIVHCKMGIIGKLFKNSILPFYKMNKNNNVALLTRATKQYQARYQYWKPEHRTPCCCRRYDAYKTRPRCPIWWQKVFIISFTLSIYQPIYNWCFIEINIPCQISLNNIFVVVFYMLRFPLVLTNIQFFLLFLNQNYRKIK